jgi:hypothetical protein
MREKGHRCDVKGYKGVEIEIDCTAILIISHGQIVIIFSSFSSSSSCAWWWLVGCLAGWLAGWLVGWLAGWLNVHLSTHHRQILLQQTSVRVKAIKRIFITHAHGDHCFGLVGLLCLMGQEFDRAQAPVDVYGPQGKGKDRSIGMHQHIGLLDDFFCIRMRRVAQSP